MVNEDLKYLKRGFADEQGLECTLTYTDKDGTIVERKGKSENFGEQYDEVIVTRPDGQKSVTKFGVWSGLIPFRRTTTYETDGTIRITEHVFEEDPFDKKSGFSYSNEGILFHEIIAKENGERIFRKYETIGEFDRKPTGDLLEEVISKKQTGTLSKEKIGDLNGKPTDDLIGEIYKTATIRRKYEKGGAYFEYEGDEIRHFLKSGVLDYYGESKRPGPHMGTMYNPDGSVRSDVSSDLKTRRWFLKDGTLEKVDEGENADRVDIGVAEYKSMDSRGKIEEDNEEYIKKYGSPKQTTYFDKNGNVIKVEKPGMVQMNGVTEIKRAGFLRFLGTNGHGSYEPEYVTARYDEKGKLVVLYGKEMKSGKEFTSKGLSARLSAAIRAGIPLSVPNLKKERE